MTDPRRPSANGHVQDCVESLPVHTISDGTRYRVLGLYTRRTAANTLGFLERIVEEMPFPIQRIQADRGRELFAVKVQEQLKEHGIKFRPNKPVSPHLNGKFERSQKTDKTEFYPTIDLSGEGLENQLFEWQHYYNWERPHGAHHGETPMAKYFETSDQTPYSDEISNEYFPESERIQNSNYKLDLELNRLETCP